MAQETALNWFLSRFNSTSYDKIKELIEQARAMEKEQIIETWKHGNLPTFLGRALTAEEYYNETYEN